MRGDSLLSRYDGLALELLVARGFAAVCWLSPLCAGIVAAMLVPQGRAASSGRRRSLPAAPDPRTAALLKAARDEFIEHGYEAARVSAVARRAGVTAGAVYSRWPHKPDVFIAALNDTFQQILPDQVIKAAGSDDARPSQQMSHLGLGLLEWNELRDVLIHAFSSARNNDAIREALVRFLNEEADQLRAIIDKAKDAGIADPEVPTEAAALVCQAVILGTQLLVSAGLEDRNVPSQAEWAAFLDRMMRATAATDTNPPEEPTPDPS